MLKERVIEAGDARIAMELGADAVFDEHGNRCSARCREDGGRDEAADLARKTYISGRMTKRLYASGSSPVMGVIR